MVDEVFEVFTSSVATPDRPLYFHTDAGALRRMFAYLNEELGYQPTMMPWRVSE